MPLQISIPLNINQFCFKSTESFDFNETQSNESITISSNEQKVGTINQTSHFSSSTFNSKFFNLRRLNYYVSLKVSNQISFHEIFEELNLDDEKPKRHKWTKQTQSCWQHLIYTSQHSLLPS